MSDLIERLKGLITNHSAVALNEETIQEIIAALESHRWIPFGESDPEPRPPMPPIHVNVWCKNRNGIEFEGRICSGFHRPFFTFPKGWKDASDTAPEWIDVIEWRYITPPEQESNQ